MKTGRKNRVLKRLRNTLVVILLLVLSVMIIFNVMTNIDVPVIEDTSILSEKRENPSPDFYRIGNSWLKKNKFGLWEMYLEGSPFEIGVINGKLTKELIKLQEDSFVDQINTLIPSSSYLKFLKYFILWFNRDIENYIPREYIEEIYGVSFSAADGYEMIGSKYERMLNYHGAHDIGHALQSLALVGCTSFAANMGLEDSSFILGRNFDFYINEDFAKNKIVAFVHPDNGYDFTYVTWASMIGVVSGMNEAGLTVTINAAKSDIPGKAKMPISLLAREILQYAGNIDEAVAIAKKRETFVSESLLIGSASDNMAVIIEKSPTKLDVYSTDADDLVCSNHYQSDAFGNDPNNTRYIEESATLYRQTRCEQLLSQYDEITYKEAADILRDTDGLDGSDIGIGNEKAMAQFISHHSIIFKPFQRELWVSTKPYQFGAYLGYNTTDVFETYKQVKANSILYDTLLTIAADSSHLLLVENLTVYRKLKEELKSYISENKRFDGDSLLISKLISYNPDYYHGYVLAGNYFYQIGNFAEAYRFYSRSLDKEFENTTTREMVKVRLEELKEKTD